MMSLQWNNLLKIVKVSNTVVRLAWDIFCSRTSFLMFFKWSYVSSFTQLTYWPRSTVSLAVRSCVDYNSGILWPWLTFLNLVKIMYQPKLNTNLRHLHSLNWVQSLMGYGTLIVPWYLNAIAISRFLDYLEMLILDSQNHGNGWFKWIPEL